MTDPYTPTLEEFYLTEDEVRVVADALGVDKPWDYKPELEDDKSHLKSVKDKIRAFHLQRHDDNCCYCGGNLTGAGAFMTDREHVLPKGKKAYKKYAYEIWNLGVACKRCNMEYKRTGDQFVVDKANPDQFQKAENYCLIHPNFDRRLDHIERQEVIGNGKKLVIFRMTRGSAKAAYTYEHFGLQSQVVDSFDHDQGLDVEDPILKLVFEVRRLARAYDQ